MINEEDEFDGTSIEEEIEESSGDITKEKFII
jgi:hypothetical protein